MSIQKESADAIIERCRQLGVKVIAGGPLFTAHPEDYGHVDHLVLNEAEITLPLFLADLAKGRPQRVYTSRALGGPHPDPAAALRSPEHEEVRLHEHPVFAGLPLRLRLLQHHGALRPGAADQGRGTGRRRARRALPAGLAQQRIHRGRQLHREQGKAQEGSAAGHHLLDGASAGIPSRSLPRCPSTWRTTRN